MTLEQKISAIVEDCCAADPSLHEREAELRPIIKSLLEAQPDTKFDAAFAKRLREAVMTQAAVAKPRKPSFVDRFRNLKRQDVLVLGSATLGLVLAVALATNSLLPVGPGDDTHIGLAPQKTAGRGIALVADSAFGSLGLGTASAPGDAGNRTAMPSGTGTTGLTMETASPEPATAPATSMPLPPMAGGDSAKMIAPDMMPYAPVAYRFVFKGQIGPLEPKVPVYRRIKGFPRDSAPIAALSATAAGVLDLSRLENPAMQTFALVENRDFGLNAFVDASEGTVSLGQHWQRWPHPETACRDEECYRRYQLTPSQLPTNDALIAAADRFLTDYGVVRDGYGSPEVLYSLHTQDTLASGERDVFIPDSIQVVYPSMLEGVTVNDDSGAATGLYVSVNIRHMRVDNVWGLSSNAYERSSYEAETDAARIAAFAEKGGTWGGWSDSSAETVEVELGEPTTVLVRSWKYREDGTSDELLVPALRFPVLNPPAEDPWFRRAVIVPLAKELLDNASAPQPMPLPAVMIK